MKRFLKSMCTMLATSLIFTGCSNRNLDITPNGNSSSSVTAPSENTPLRSVENINLPYFEDDILDPYSCETLQSFYLSGLLCDPLVLSDTANKVKYRLAHDITAVPSGYVISLRNDAFFSDGSPVTAQDVIYSYNLAKSSVRYSAMLSGVTEVSAVDNTTVKFTLAATDVFFPKSLVFPIIKEGTQGNAIPIGVGRFVADLQNQRFVYNPKHYSPVKNVRTITLIATPSLESQSLLLMEGKIDLIYSDLQSDLNLGLGIGYRQIPLSNLVFLGFNPSYNIQKTIRQAISAVIDREDIGRRAYTGFATPTTLPFSPISAITDITASDISPDREKAKQLLESTGATQTFEGVWQYYGKPMSYEIIVNNNNSERMAAAEQIAAQLNTFGLNIKVTPLAYNEYTRRISAGEYQLYIGEMRIPYNMNLEPLLGAGYNLRTPLVQIAPQTTENLENGESTPESIAASIPTGVTTQKIYNLVHAGETEQNILEKALREDLPVIPLVFKRGILCFSRDFSANIVATEQDIFYNIEEW